MFLSYRRGLSWPAARLVLRDLVDHDFDVFMDVRNLDSGDFASKILTEISRRAHFIVVLEPGSLNRIGEPGDWMRREIAHALQHERNVVPLFVHGFTFPPEIVWPAELAGLPNLNAVQVPADYFDEAMQKLRQRFLRAPVPATPPAATDTGSAVAESPLQPTDSELGRLGAPIVSVAADGQGVIVSWARIPGAVDYVVERTARSSFAASIVVYRGPSTEFREPDRPAPWSYRVRAIGPGRTAGPWSAPAGRATDEVPPGQSGSGRPWTLQLGLAAMIVGALPLLYVGAVALLSPRNPLTPSGAVTGIAFLLAGIGPGLLAGAAFTGRGWSRLPLAVLVGLLGLIVVATGSASSPATFWYGLVIFGAWVTGVIALFLPQSQAFFRDPGAGAGS